MDKRFVEHDAVFSSSRTTRACRKSWISAAGASHASRTRIAVQRGPEDGARIPSAIAILTSRVPRSKMLSSRPRCPCICGCGYLPSRTRTETPTLSSKYCGLMVPFGPCDLSFHGEMTAVAVWDTSKFLSANHESNVGAQPRKSHGALVEKSLSCRETRVESWRERLHLRSVWGRPRSRPTHTPGRIGTSWGLMLIRPGARRSQGAVQGPPRLIDPTHGTSGKCELPCVHGPQH